MSDSADTYPLQALFVKRQEEHRDAARAYAAWRVDAQTLADRAQALCEERDEHRKRLADVLRDSGEEGAWTGVSLAYRRRFRLSADEELGALEREMYELEERCQSKRLEGEPILKRLVEAEKRLFQLESHHREWADECRRLRSLAQSRREEEIALQHWLDRSFSAKG